MSVNVLIYTLIISLVFMTGLILFFRVTDREIRRVEGELVSPADGKILDIREVIENEYFKKSMTRISIFMSLFNLHLNRVPVDGKIISIKYYKGRYLLAFHPKSSELNEHNNIIIKTNDGHEILVRQIAGGLARRIVCFLHESDEVKAGDEMGFIKFGSRVDVFLPDAYEVKISKMSNVKAGLTLLAKLRKN